jgi:hypothetical protein
MLATCPVDISGLTVLEEPFMPCSSFSGIACMVGNELMPSGRPRFRLGVSLLRECPDKLAERRWWPSDLDQVGIGDVE